MEGDALDGHDIALYGKDALSFAFRPRKWAKTRGRDGSGFSLVAIMITDLH